MPTSTCRPYSSVTGDIVFTGSAISDRSTLEAVVFVDAKIAVGEEAPEAGEAAAGRARDAVSSADAGRRVCGKAVMRQEGARRADTHLTGRRDAWRGRRRELGEQERERRTSRPCRR